MPKANEEWVEKTGGNFWQPKEEGDEIQGKLIEIRDGTFGKVYDIEQEDKTILTVPTSTYLQNRITPKDVGKTMRLVFEGLQQSKIKGRQAARIFRVFTKS